VDKISRSIEQTISMVYLQDCKVKSCDSRGVVGNCLERIEGSVHFPKYKKDFQYVAIIDPVDDTILEITLLIDFTILEEGSTSLFKRNFLQPQSLSQAQHQTHPLLCFQYP
jgi:hypothetical protein